MGSQKTPETYSPGQAAQAAMGTAAAGEGMSIANQPIDQYGNLITTEALGPAQIQLQGALANRAALQGAKAQMDIQSRVDPQAYAQRQMRMNATNQKLGRLYGVDPTKPIYRAADAYTVPGAEATPSLDQLQKMGAGVASRLSIGSVNKFGGDPMVLGPNNPVPASAIPLPTPQSYF